MSSLQLGYDPETGITRILPERDRYQSTYVIGAAGAGKSGLLQNLIIQDAAAHNAVINIDPHGDLVNSCLAALPPDCLIRTSVLDMEDEEWPYGCNVFFEAGMLKTGAERTEAMERIYHIFEVLWPEVNSQQYLPTLLKATISVFLDNPGATLYDMMRFFRMPEFRRLLLANVKDPTIVDDFTYEFEARTDKEKETRAQPLMNRLRGLFVGRPLPTNILRQRHQSLNIRRSIDRRELLFIKLPTTTMRQDARLLGTILLGQISAAIFSYKDTAPEQRPGVSVYVDEFANFATRDFERLVSEARKFGARLTVAHQQRDQLPDFLDKPTLNARTKIVFRVEPSDATTMGKLFPQQGGEFIPSRAVIKEVLHAGSDFPDVVRDFADVYLRSLKRSGEVDVKGLEPGLMDYLLTGTNGKVKPPKVSLANPVSALDDLFYEVMAKGNPYLPIPPLAVEGLCNGGMGFFAALKRANPNWLLWAPQDFPAHLVGGYGDDWYWLRRPEDAREQLLHCIFHIRMVMLHVAQHPIGKTSSGSDNVAQMLVQLPDRWAFVSSSEGPYTIRTHDLPPALEGHAKLERLRMLRDQTRARYCHRREEVERQDMPAQPSQGQAAAVGGVAIGRSEEIAS